jgi:hypothetical protein
MMSVQSQCPQTLWPLAVTVVRWAGLVRLMDVSVSVATFNASVLTLDWKLDFRRVARRYALLFAIDQINIESDRLTTASMSLLHD